MKLIDSHGNIIHNLRRTNGNALSVCDTESFQKYQMETNNNKRLNILEKELSDIKTSLELILNMMEKKH